MDITPFLEQFTGVSHLPAISEFHARGSVHRFPRRRDWLDLKSGCTAVTGLSPGCGDSRSGRELTHLDEVQAGRLDLGQHPVRR
jgi:hypothetical protein